MKSADLTTHKWFWKCSQKSNVQKLQVLLPGSLNKLPESQTRHRISRLMSETNIAPSWITNDILFAKRLANTNFLLQGMPFTWFHLLVHCIDPWIGIRAEIYSMECKAIHDYLKVKQQLNFQNPSVLRGQHCKSQEYVIKILTFCCCRLSTLCDTKNEVLCGLHCFFWCVAESLITNDLDDCCKLSNNYASRVNMGSLAVKKTAWLTIICVHWFSIIYPSHEVSKVITILSGEAMHYILQRLYFLSKEYNKIMSSSIFSHN